MLLSMTMDNGRSPTPLKPVNNSSPWKFESKRLAGEDWVFQRTMWPHFDLDKSPPLDLLELTVPFWIPMFLSVVVGAVGWRLDLLATRRSRVGLCPHCRYPREGLASPEAACPECGKARE